MKGRACGRGEAHLVSEAAHARADGLLLHHKPAQGQLAARLAAKGSHAPVHLAVLGAGEGLQMVGTGGSGGSAACVSGFCCARGGCPCGAGTGYWLFWREYMAARRCRRRRRLGAGCLVLRVGSWGLGAAQWAVGRALQGGRLRFRGWAWRRWWRVEMLGAVELL
jgi:hypothetical protein